MSFFEQIPDTFPRQYQIVETAPITRGSYKATPPFIVHTKLHGSFTKAQPFVVRGVRRSGELLMQKIGDFVEPGCHESYTAIYADGTWHTQDGSGTVEGFRFNKMIRKVFIVLGKLARDVGKERAKVAKIAKDFDDRGARCGICPCCFGDYVATGDKMVHHGYERPGHGSIIGDCFGVNAKPFEISCERTQKYLELHQHELVAAHAWLTRIPTLDQVTVEKGSKSVNNRWVPNMVALNRGEPGFDRAIASKLIEAQYSIDSLDRAIVKLTDAINNWKPATWPRVVTKGSK